MLLRWPPNYEKLVLTPGDPNATHVGGKGGIQMTGVGVSPAPAAEMPNGDLEWLRDNGIDWAGESA
jgi:hypothetical protein